MIGFLVFIFVVWFIFALIYRDPLAFIIGVIRGVLIAVCIVALLILLIFSCAYFSR
jgi:hypothetical protein